MKLRYVFLCVLLLKVISCDTSKPERLNGSENREFWGIKCRCWNKEKNAYDPFDPQVNCCKATETIQTNILFVLILIMFVAFIYMYYKKKYVEDMWLHDYSPQPPTENENENQEDTTDQNDNNTNQNENNLQENEEGSVHNRSSLLLNRQGK